MSVEQKDYFMSRRKKQQACDELRLSNPERPEHRCLPSRGQPLAEMTLATYGVERHQQASFE